MATLTKSFVENEFSTDRGTWTITATGTNITVTGSTFVVKPPSMTAKCAGTDKYYADLSLTGKTLIESTVITSTVFAGKGENITPGTVFSLSRSSGDSSKTVNTSTYFNSNNSTTKTLNLTYQVPSCSALSSRTSRGGAENSYSGSLGTLGTLQTITLNAPPTFSEKVVSSGDYMAHVSDYSVQLSSVSAKYGGTISKTKLTVGNQSVTGSGSGTLTIRLNASGTFTPTVAVTDSRGQTTTKTLPSITVSPYIIGIQNIEADRLNETTMKLDVEGRNAVFSLTINRSVFEGNYLLEPTVTIEGTTTQNITWYEQWDDENGFRDEIIWSDFAPGGTVTIYGKCTDTLDDSVSYPLTFRANGTYASGSAITATLPQAFYLLSGKAGGKALGIGMKARADGELDIALEIFLSLVTTAPPGTKDGDLYSAITALGWGSEVIN